LQAIRSRSDGSGAPGDGSGRANHHMLTKYYNGFRKAFEEAIIDHGLCAFCCLFTRLEHCHQRSSPCITCLCEQCRRSSEPGYVQVVTTHMSHRHRVSLAVLHLDFAGIRKTRRLLDGQGVHVGAQHHGRTVAVAEQADNAGLSDSRRHVITSAAKPIGG
jgi:hypothetical protein